MPDRGAILEVSGLVRRFRGRRSRPFGPRSVVSAVDGVSFSVRHGEAFGLVGESGCGKSTTAKTILGIYPPSGGVVRFDGRSLAEMTPTERQALRADMQYVFQDPLGALDPRKPILAQVVEPLIIHRRHRPEEREARARSVLRAFGLGPESEARYPHELSGGQRQRVVLARAMVLEPKLLICDEPVSALDVSIQAQVINQLQELRRRDRLTLLFISHDLSLVRHLCDRVAVMYLGGICEIASTDALFATPRHPYSRALISSIPSMDPLRGQDAGLLKGEPPSPLKPPAGCRFHPRCPSAIARCGEDPPVARPLRDGHLVACHLAHRGPDG